MALPLTTDTSRRTGATWVAGTGAFLLLAAAAVFIAVRWDELPDAAKLGLVGALTGAFLLGGRTLRRTLPATGDVLFHLGALLIPIDVAGLHLRTGQDWRSLVLAEGVIGVATLTPLATVSGSVVLGWAAVAAVVAFAAGIAAVSVVPAPLVLAAAAVGAMVVGRQRLATTWAALAGLAPATGLALAGLVQSLGTSVGTGVLEELGLTGRTAGLLAVVSGGVAATVVGVDAHRRRDLGLAVLAIATAVSSVATTWTAADLDGRSSLLALPAAFLAVELLAALSERDPFWRRLATVAGNGVEVVAAALTLVPLTALVVYAPLVEEGFDLFSDDPGWTPDIAAGTSLAVLAAAWFIAGLRHQHGGASLSHLALRAASALPTSVPFVLSAIVAVEVGTASNVATSVVLLAIAACFAVTAGVVPAIGVAPAALWATVTSWQHTEVAMVVGLAGGAVVAEAARRRHDRGAVVFPHLLAAAAVGIAGTGCALAASTIGIPAVLGLGIIACWALGWSLDRTASSLGSVARLGLVPAAFVALGQEAAVGIPMLGMISALWAADAIRLDEPTTAFGASFTVQLLVIAVGAATGLDPATTGLGLCISAIVWAGQAVIVSDRWREPFLAGAVGASVLGLGLAAHDGRMFVDSLIVIGGVVLGAGVLMRREEIGHLGGALMTAGILGHLGLTGVHYLEAYAAPVALHLVVAGALARRRGFVSSWVAFGPAIALLGGTALAERIGGGAGWHAVLAGAVGVAAVAAGGALRMIAPLLLGTALLVAVTIIESLTALAGVPTWGWLAVGGTSLLGVAVALERADTSPAEAGRRLVDVIGERFD
jgi:hypothetical protein